jgi:SNF2 family DNA or RNA helicase
MKRNKIVINITDNEFVLTGNTNSILNSRRALMTFKRLLFQHVDDKLIIPYNENTKINTLQTIEHTLDKLDINIDIGETVEQVLASFNREQKNFNIFSEKAKKIRNNEFDNEPDIIEDFKKFKDIINNNMIRTLYPLQLLSSFHMAFAQNSCNFAVPGAGKTTIVYGAYVYLKNLPKDNPKHVDKLLVIGPLSSFAPWENEFEACFGKKVSSQRMSGDFSISRAQKEQHLYSDNPKELTLISHAGISLLEREIIDFLKRNKVMVVVDEAHRIKNIEGVWGRSAIEIAKEAASKVILTGTPLPNGYEDIYNLYQFIYPFKCQEILQINYDQLKEMTKNMVSPDDERVKKFTKNISPYFIRIKKSDLNLPPPIEHLVKIDMDNHHRLIYNFVEKKYINIFKNNPTATIKDIFNRARLIRLRQASTNPSLLLKPLHESLEHSSEFDRNDPNYKIAEINNASIDDIGIFQKITDYEKLYIPQKFIKIEELLKNEIFANHGRAIVWTIFIQNAEQLQNYLKQKNISSKLLIGRIPQNEREEIIEQFNNPKYCDFKVVIANPFSVSESISLHKGCHNAIYLERDYNAASFIQSRDRIHRVGLPEDIDTHYYYLVSKKSIDMIIDKKLSDKVNRMEKIINEEIPLFARINDSDETDIINELLKDYAQRT